jgi:uncharacterized surface protein with fasciclin (FAS1) repeats
MRCFNIKYTACVLGLAGLILAIGCKKDNGYYDYKNNAQVFNGSTYEYLKAKPGMFDSLVKVLDVTALADSLKEGQYTLFAPTDLSFKFMMENLNAVRKVQGKGPLHLGTVDKDELDSIIIKYVLRGATPSDSMTFADGLALTSIQTGYPMHGKQHSTDATGYVGGGPHFIEFSDTKRSQYIRMWISATTSSIDLRTKNGVINVLRDDHVIGFNEFITRLNN